MSWRTAAPAKINLDLRMRGRRDDGYHLLSTVLQSIALADTLTLTPRPGPFALVCETAGVPVDDSNLAWRGAAAMASALRVRLDGWQLRLDKAVPSEAGLGGGSADAAAAARLVAAASGRRVDASALAEVIRPLGADVAFFAWGGTMLGEGVGDALTIMPDAGPAAVLIVRPPFGVSTRQAYGWFDESDGAAARAPNMARRPKNASTVVSTSGRATAGATRRWSFGNDLEAPVASRHPEIRAIVDRLRDAGATHAAMSGSGSACFGLFEPAADLSALLSGWPEGTRVWPTRLLDRVEYDEATAVTDGA
jgi:4-diphosphocytidyl-2-C-methyl-D-erythritol kinase